MTTDEALAAVKQAVEQLLPRVEHRKAMMTAHGHDMAAPFDAAQLNVLIAALRAIAPGGPLVVMPRELTKEMIWAAHQEIDWCRNTQNTAYPRHETQKENIGGEPIGTFCEDDIRDAYRAMIAEGEKQ